MSNKHRNYNNYNNYSNQNKTTQTNLEIDETVQAVVEPEVESETLVTNETDVPVTNEPETSNEDIPVVEAVKVIFGVVDNCEKLNIRVQPNAKANIVKVINKGETVEINENDSTDDFYAVSVANVNGYCMKNFIKLK